MVAARSHIDIYGGRKPTDIPLYTLPEAAHHLRLPTNTVRSWVSGRGYETTNGRRRSSPIVRPADQDGLLLSFGNLTELHVLSAIRKVHHVTLAKVRAAVDFMRNELKTEHPLLEKGLLTDG